MSKYYLVLWDSSPNSNPIYLRFEIDRYSTTTVIYLLQKISKVDYDNDVDCDVASAVDTNYSRCDMMLVQGDDPTIQTRQRAREIWKERIGEGRWGRISEEEVYQECVPEYIMHQIIDGMPVE